MTRLTICGASFAVAVVMLVFVFSMTAAKSTSATVIYQLFYSGFVEIFSWMHVYSESRIFNFIIMLRRDCGVFVWNRALTILQIMGCGSYEALTFARQKRTIGRKIRPAWCWICLWWCIGVLCGGCFGACTIVTIIMAGPIIQWTVQKF